MPAQIPTPTRTVGAPRPAPIEMGFVARLAGDVRRERRVRRRFKLPPGSTAPSWSHTRRIISDPLGLLLEHQSRFGPVFTIRLLHEPIVWAIGAEVNHQILVVDLGADRPHDRLVQQPDREHRPEATLMLEQQPQWIGDDPTGVRPAGRGAARRQLEAAPDSPLAAHIAGASRATKPISIGAGRGAPTVRVGVGIWLGIGEATNATAAGAVPECRLSRWSRPPITPSSPRRPWLGPSPGWPRSRPVLRACWHCSAAPATEPSAGCSVTGPASKGWGAWNRTSPTSEPCSRI